MSGGAGSTLTVTFNAAATTAIVELVVESLTYANSSDTPTASRGLTITVTDAAGGRNLGAATFTELSGASNPFNAISYGANHISSPAMMDADGDGDLDLLIGVDFGFAYYRNDGGAFTAVTGASNPFNGLTGGYRSSPAFGDIDGDGDLDLVSGNFTNGFAVFLNNGSNAFSSGGNLGGLGFGQRNAVALGDIDGDGDADFAFGNGGGDLLLYRNDGGGVLTSIPIPAPDPDIDYFFSALATRPAFVDLDGDGDLDMMVGKQQYGNAFAYRNNGDNTFTQIPGAQNPFESIALRAQMNPTFADVDGDGDLDMVSGSFYGGIEYLRNDQPVGATLTVTVTAEADGSVGTTGPDVLTGAGTADTIDGGDGDDIIDGGAGDDTLIGGAGSDFLKGGAGADTMTGGIGNDTYVVDDLGDSTDETGGDGIDKVRAVISWTLGTDIENLELIGNTPLSGTGNSLGNVITGGTGNNHIQGLDGDDTLLGMAGNDLLEGGNGIDSLDGGAGADDLRGGGDADTLTGGKGDDRLDGGDGADTMTGGEGSDVYVVDNPLDVVIELAGTSTGLDTIEASVTYTLSANVENLTQTGTADINGTGNALKNLIIGNSGANTLDGADGHDTINGGDGNDSLIGGAGVDVLKGGTGADRLSGGDGADLLTGGTGGDTFAFTQDDVHLTTLGGKADIDKVYDLSFVDGDVIDLTGIDAIVGTPAEDSFTFVTKFTKVAGQATLIYGAGNNLTTLQLDVDGDGISDLTVQITGSHAASAANTYTGGADADGGWWL